VIGLDKFIKPVVEEKTERKEERGIIIPFPKTFRNFISYISKADVYETSIGFEVNGDRLRASYMSSDRIWMAIMEMPIRNYLGDVKFCVEPSSIMPYIIGDISKIVIDEADLEGFGKIRINGEEMPVLVSECSTYPEPKLEDKLTEKLVIDVRKFKKLLKEHVLTEPPIFTLTFITLDNQLTLRWKNYYSDGHHKIKVSPFIARVLKSSNAIQGYDINILKKLLNYPANRIILEYGAEVPMRMTLENSYGRNVRIWLAPRGEEED